MPETKKYNLQYLQSLSSDPGFVREMILLYLQTIPPMLEALMVAAASNNQEGMRKTLHQLKPAAAAVGMNAIKADIEQLELALKSGPLPENGQNTLNNITAVFEECLQQLGKEVV